MGGAAGCPAQDSEEGGTTFPQVHPKEVCRSQGRVRKLTWMMGKWPSEGGEGWGHSGTMQQLTSPPQTNADVDCLLSMLVAGLRMGTPWISTFSGDATPGKTKVSFVQWYYEVQSIKDHYPEAVVQESIIRSLKGAAAGMARHVGPTTSINHILGKISVIFGTVASFDILMQNFYKVTQGNNEKVPSFARRLEGSLIKYSFSALDGWWLWRHNSTSRIALSCGLQTHL